MNLEQDLDRLNSNPKSILKNKSRSINKNVRFTESTHDPVESREF